MTLANTIASTSNPLTSRVAVNRLWHHLLGRGIVESVDNFGVLGTPPTHPELLDYLASDFTQSRWSLKGMIRKIVLSKTYQMNSRPNEAATDVDPDNRLLHRANVKRLTGESIRDSMLMIAGKLNEQRFGPPVPIHLTPFMQGRGRPGRNGPLDGNGRRSVYIEVRRNFLSPMMLAFDTPIPFNTTGRRNRSNVPAQALILLNDPLVIQLADHWAKNLLAESLDFDATITRIYHLAFAKAPNANDFEYARLFFKTQAEQLGIATEAALKSQEVWRDYCHVIFNVKDFIYVH